MTPVDSADGTRPSLKGSVGHCAESECEAIPMHMQAAAGYYLFGRASSGGATLIAVTRRVTLLRGVHDSSHVLDLVGRDDNAAPPFSWCGGRAGASAGWTWSG